jgi:hypothetical protein
MAELKNLELKVSIVGGISAFEVYLEGLPIRTFYYDSVPGVWRAHLDQFGIEGKLNVSFHSSGWHGGTCTLDVIVKPHRGLREKIVNQHGPLNVLNKRDIDLAEDTEFA